MLALTCTAATWIPVRVHLMREVKLNAATINTLVDLRCGLQKFIRPEYRVGRSLFN